MAPEMINRRKHNQMVDVWALGILLYELVHGRAPYRGDQHDIARVQVSHEVQFKKNLTKDYKDLVLKLLEYEPSKRIALI